MTDFAARDSSRIIRGGETSMAKSKSKGMMMPGTKTFVPGPKHTFTKTKKVRGEPKIGGPGLSPRMKRNKGMSAAVDAHGKKSMRKHGIRI
jgi:hypothetical protein